MRTTALLTLVFCAACGTKAPGIVDPSASLFPLAVGHRWEYRVEDIDQGQGVIETKVQTVTGQLAVNQRRGYQLVTTNGIHRTESVQVVDDTRLIRVSEDEFLGEVRQSRIVFGPPSVRLDLDRAELGATYAEQHTEVHLDLQTAGVLSWVTKDHTFIVEAVEESVTVPAGTFRAVKIRRDSTGGPSKTYWYARGVGKIKEVGGQTEELAAYELAPMN